MSLFSREFPPLRHLIIRSAVFFLIFSLIGLFLVRDLEKFSIFPLCKAYEDLCRSGGLITLGILGPLNAILYLTLFFAILFFLPYITLEFFFYLRSGLKKREKMILSYMIVLALQIYAISLFLSYKLLPTILLFFQLDRATEIYRAIITYPDYIKFLIYYYLLVFIYSISPIILIFCISTGVLRYENIKRFWRISLFISFLIACSLVPSNDITTIVLVSSPIFGMYCFALLFSYIYRKSKNRKNKN